jgi:hypothetical protein
MRAFSVAFGIVLAILLVFGQSAPSVAQEAPTPTANQTASNLSIYELKYRLMDVFGKPSGNTSHNGIFYCDPVIYPATYDGKEKEMALSSFPTIRHDKDIFRAIIERLHWSADRLAEDVEFSEDDMLTVFREYNQLYAIHLELEGTHYLFKFPIARDYKFFSVSGQIDYQGIILITSVQSLVSMANYCPVCLAKHTRIDSPAGQIPVEDLREGMIVWTLNEAGTRVAAKIIRTSRTAVPANHEIVHLRLSDGRELKVSPAHPLSDGRLVGELAVGDSVDGATAIDVGREPYTEPYTYDLLPEGATGFYWANGVLIGSTLKVPNQQERAYFDIRAGR